MTSESPHLNCHTLYRPTLSTAVTDLLDLFDLATCRRLLLLIIISSLHLIRILCFFQIWHFFIIRKVVVIRFIVSSFTTRTGTQFREVDVAKPSIATTKGRIAVLAHEIFVGVGVLLVLVYPLVEVGPEEVKLEFC